MAPFFLAWMPQGDEHGQSGDDLHGGVRGPSSIAVEKGGRAVKRQNKLQVKCGTVEVTVTEYVPVVLVAVLVLGAIAFCWIVYSS